MDCEGCKDNPQCQLHQWGHAAIDNCPCRICVVKVICATPCDKLSDHYGECFRQQK